MALGPPLAVFLILYYVYRSSQPIVRPLDPDIRLTIQPERHPVKSYAQLPTGVAKQLPKVQYDFPVETEAEHKERVRRKAAVTDAFLHTWNGYKKYAWKNDEITPLSGRFRNPFGGWGASLVDTMDTLWMLGSDERVRGVC